MNELAKQIYTLTPDFVKRDFPRKFIALFFAFLVWISVVNKLGVVSRIPKVDVNLSLPEDIVLLDDSPPRVTLKVSASKKRLNQLYPSSFTIRKKIDENLFTPGVPYELTIEPSDVKAPFGVDVLDVEPESFFINLDHNMTKTVEVKPKLTGSPPAGFAASKVRLIPAEVKITGPRGIVENIKTVHTEPIALDKTTIESFDYVIGVNAKQGNLTVTPPQVMAQVEIRKASVSRIFDNVPIRVLKPTGKRYLEVIPLSTPHVSVTVSGMKKNMKHLAVDQIKAFIDLSPFDEPGTYTVPVNCWATEGNVTIGKITPEQVKVNVVKSNSESKNSKEEE